MSNVERRKKGMGGGSLAALAAIPLAAAGSWIVYSKLAINHNVPLAEAIPAKRVVYAAKTAVNLSYYVDERAEGRPLLLIHGINLTASAYDVLPLFEHYRSQRPVYALELPGFGFSERPDRLYSPQYFAESILDFLETQVGKTADVITLSLSSEFVGRAALAQPELFRSLAFISPTGLGKAEKDRDGQHGRFPWQGNTFYSFLSTPIWAQALFDLMTTRRGIKLALNQSFVGPLPPGFLEYAYATSHQPGARHVPLRAISGKLATPDVRVHVYEKVRTPALVIYDRDPYTRFDALPDLLQKNPAWREVRIGPSLGMPHFEKLPETTEALTDFWQGLART